MFENYIYCGYVELTHPLDLTANVYYLFLNDVFLFEEVPKYTKILQGYQKISFYVIDYWKKTLFYCK